MLARIWSLTPVGRWAASNRLTPCARPTRVMLSNSSLNSGLSVIISAYSSMMMYRWGYGSLLRCSPLARYSTMSLVPVSALSFWRRCISALMAVKSA